jgi:pimeloyl-ACP methyl ester carboxylesterase
MDETKAPNRLTSMRRATRMVAAAALIAVVGLSGVAAAGASADDSGDRHEPKPTIVLVHGAFADASGWNDVITRLDALGYPTIAPANPLRGLPVDVPYLESVLANIEGPIILVGHSYGGEVITNAATGNPNVTGLVYVAAFAPAEGESSGALAAMFPGSMLTPDNLLAWSYPTTDASESGVEGYIKPEVFREVFAADLPARTTAAMAATQRPADFASLQQPSGPPAWATVPSWFVVAKHDNAIPPDTQRFEAQRANAVKTIEVRSSHVAMMSKPKQVVSLIVEAARYQG